MDAGGLRAFVGSCSPCAPRNFSRIPHKFGCRQPRRKVGIVVRASDIAVADDVWWLQFSEMGSLVPSSCLQSFSQGALLQCKAKTMDESPDTVTTKRWRYEDGMEARATSGRSASTSGHRANGLWRFKTSSEIESLEVLTSTQALQARCNPKNRPGIRSSEGIEETQCSSSSTISIIEHTVPADCSVGLSVTIDPVDYISVASSLENGPLSDLSTSLNNEASAPSNPNSSKSEQGSEVVKKESLETLRQQLGSLSGKKERGNGKASAKQLPDKIEDLLPVDPNKDPAEYLFLYTKLLGAGRLQDCLSILESLDEFSVVNKVNPHDFYSACKKSRAVKEAFRFSQLAKKSLRNYNMLLSVCAQARDASAACRVHEMARNAGLQADCIFYTTLISACAKAGRIDLMFKFLNEMETKGVEANVQTFGAMIDGCARAGDVPKAFGIYKKMLNKNVKPDRVIFNTLITACGRAGALVRAFEVLENMRDELDGPVALDHFTYGALIAACARAGEVERALEVYKRMRSSKVVATTECYTAAVHACSPKGYIKVALSIYEDMKNDGVRPDEVFFCALIDVAGHAGKLDEAFAILQELKSTGISPSPATYNTLMVVCSNVGDADSAMQVYEEIKFLGLTPTVSTLNALVASLCAGGELDCALTVLQEFRIAGVMPNKDTYSILLAACEREDELSIALKLYNQSKGDSVQPALEMCESILELCVRRVESETPPPYNPRLLNISTNDAEASYQFWSKQGLVVYDDLRSAGLIPSLGIINQVLGCLRVSQHHLYDERSLRKILSVDDACGIYLPRALTFYEDVTTLGVIQNVNYAAVPTIVDMRKVSVYAGEVGVLALLKGLKLRHDEGLYLNSVKLTFAVESKQAFTARGGFKRLQVSSRTGAGVVALLRRLRIKYEGHESAGEVSISSAALRNWLRATQKVQPVKNVQNADSLSCSQADALASVTRSKQKLSHYSLRAVENAPVV